MQTSKKGAIVIGICCAIIGISYVFYKNQHQTVRVPPIVVDTPTTLENTSWVWQYTALPDGKKLLAEKSQFVLTFTHDGLRVVSTTDCNTLSSTYIKNEEVLSFAPFASTKMFCKKSQETTYIEQLELTTSYRISGDWLTINLNLDAGTMTFQKKTTPQTVSSTTDAGN